MQILNNSKCQNTLKNDIEVSMIQFLLGFVPNRHSTAVHRSVFHSDLGSADLVVNTEQQFNLNRSVLDIMFSIFTSHFGAAEVTFIFHYFITTLKPDDTQNIQLLFVFFN